MATLLQKLAIFLTCLRKPDLSQTPGSHKAASAMTIIIFLLEVLEVAQVLVPTSLFRIQDLKTRTAKIQVHFAFLSVIYSPNLSSHSPAFPSATIYIRMFFSFLK